MIRIGHTIRAVTPFTDDLVRLEMCEVLNGLISWRSKASSNSHNLLSTDKSQLSIGEITVCWIDAASLCAAYRISYLLTYYGKDTYARNGAAREVPFALCKKY